MTGYREPPIHEPHPDRTALSDWTDREDTDPTDQDTEGEGPDLLAHPDQPGLLALMDLIRYCHPDPTIDRYGEITLTHTPTHVIVLSKMLFNWRLQVTPPAHWGLSFAHAYCYQHTSIATLLRALEAAGTWDPGPNLDQPPAGYDKQAY